jgi:hypothetical protein
MPKKLENALRRTARKRGYSRERTSAYVYGTLRDMGWTPKIKSKKPRKK